MIGGQTGSATGRSGAAGRVSRPVTAWRSRPRPVDPTVGAAAGSPIGWRGKFPFRLRRVLQRSSSSPPGPWCPRADDSSTRPMGWWEVAAVWRSVGDGSADVPGGSARRAGSVGEGSVPVVQEDVDQGMRPWANAEGLLNPAAGHVLQAAGGLVRACPLWPLTRANDRSGQRLT